MNRPPALRLLSAAVALTFTACSGGHETTGANPAATLPTLEVNVAVVDQAVNTMRQRMLPATVRATQRATLAAKVMGTVTITPAIGSEVAAGDTLITIAAAELTAAVSQAQAALDLSTRNHQREADLLQRGASTAEMVRNLDDQRRIDTARLEGARAQLAYTTLTAPFAGRITSRQIEVGDLATPGTPLVTLEGAALEIEVAIPESMNAPQVGMPAQAILDGRILAGTIREATLAADPVTRSRLARIALNDSSSVHAGQFVQVQWPDELATVLSVPSSAVTSFGQMQRVFVVVEGRASLRLVKVGQIQPDTTVILSGLNPGETIVTHPPAALRDGQPLKVRTSASQ